LNINVKRNKQRRSELLFIFIKRQDKKQIKQKTSSTNKKPLKLN